MKGAASAEHTQTCPLSSPGTHTGGVLMPGQFKVQIEGKSAIREQDQCPCAAGGPNVVQKGSSKVKVNGMGIARIGDPTAHGGMISTGSLKVLVGG